jgi:tRNA 2-thiocytidine biosynthesis protein TtcA
VSSQILQIGISAPGKRRPLFAGREEGAFRWGSKLEKTIVRRVGEAVGDFDLISDGDRIMVCVSGGKDSYALLDALRVLRRRSPVRFDLFALNVDQGWRGYDTAAIREHLRAEGVEFIMESATYAEIVEEKLQPGQTPCSLCSRFRRAYLYDAADRHGCNKIALGHHMDDLIETLLLNLFFSGRLASMPPRLVSDDGKHVVIRPLAYVAEEETKAFARERGYPIVRCGCLSCGLPDQKRQVVKRMLIELERENPGLKRQMLGALRNVNPGHLLDPSLLDKITRSSPANS